MTKKLNNNGLNGKKPIITNHAVERYEERFKSCKDPRLKLKRLYLHAEGWVPTLKEGIAYLNGEVAMIIVENESGVPVMVTTDHRERYEGQICGNIQVHISSKAGTKVRA